MSQQNSLSKKYLILAAGVLTMLFAGIIYAWSILKTPFASELGYETSTLALNYTLTMSFFCLGGFFSSQLVKSIGSRLTIMISGALAGLGFILTSFLSSENAWMLYLTYALFSGSGIGISYIVILSMVNSWFPDRRGFSSGAQMMGFGVSSLLFGKIADALFQSSVGWRKTYIFLGLAIAIVMILSAFIIKAPDESVVFPEKKITKTAKEDFEPKDYTPLEMIRRFTFWRVFIGLSCLAAIGNSVISFARDLAISVGAEAGLATTLVGILAVCNGLGRILTGAAFDSLGRRITMISAGILAIFAAGTTLLAVCITSLPLCVVGLCLTGFAYSTVPTVSSAFIASFYGQKHFSTNLSICGFNLMVGSFIATACSSLQVSSGGFTLPFILLLALAMIAFILYLTIKKP